MRNLIGRKEAEEIAGATLVQQLDNMQAVESGVIQYNGTVEYKAELSYMNGDDQMWITAYYYPHAEDLEAAENLDDIFWIIEGYEIF